MSSVIECKDTTEKIELFEPYGLYIKPIARLNITIQLPPTKYPGQVVSSNEILDKLRKQSLPDEFIFMRVIKATLEYIRCEAEVENKSSFKNLISKLDGSVVKMAVYSDVLKVRAAETKVPYASRHDWDSFFSDAQNPDAELKHGERPDTVFVADLPAKWFAERTKTTNATNSERPSEQTVRDVFSIFGDLRLVELTNERTTSDGIVLFDAYIQYKDYISFVKAMDTFRGMKLLYINEAKSTAHTANIRVDFDRTRYLSDKEIKKREIDKLKAIEVEKIKVAQQEREKEKEAKQKEIANFQMLISESILDKDNDENADVKTKEQRRKEREEIRKQRQLAKKQHEEQKKLESRIALEERKILIAQRKLESMRLLEELLNRVKVIVAQEELNKRKKELKEADEKKRLDDVEMENAKRIKLELEENELREKIMKNINKMTDESASPSAVEEEQFELRKYIEEVPTAENFMSSPSSGGADIAGTGMGSAVPRAVLLSNPQLVIKQKQLYEETDVAEEASENKATEKMDASVKLVDEEEGEID